MSLQLAPTRPHPPSVAARAGAPWRCGFAINGRFLTQPVTGVQRYAREVTHALDRILDATNGTATLLLPPNDRPLPPFRSIEVTRTGPGQGHLWEQAVLPFRNAGPLLNLCNVAPAFGPAQVVCIHDANVFTEPASYSRVFRHYYQRLQPWIARRALRVTSVSKDAALQIGRHLGIAPGRIEVLPNGHEHALGWSASRSTLFDDYPPERPYVLMLGSRAKHKNIGRIIGLADRIDALGLDILIAGQASPIFAGTELGSAPNIRWLGKVCDDDLALLMSKALCLAFPSLTEGFGLPVVEAMVFGCPVVSSNRASLPEVCGTAALMADPDDSQAWLDHFANLARSSTLRGEMRERGGRQFRKFSWAASAQGYLDLFGRGVAL